MNTPSDPTGSPTPERREMAHKLSGYADAIAAFSFIQSAAFCLTIATSKDLNDKLLHPRGAWIVFCLVTAAVYVVYWLGTAACHCREIRLIGKDSDWEIEKSRAWIRNASGWIVVAGGTLAVASELVLSLSS